MPHVGKIGHDAIITAMRRHDLDPQGLDLLGEGSTLRAAIGHHPGAGQGKVLPCPGLGHLVIAEGLHRGRDRPLPARGAQAHVDLV